ncbi:MAG TPA: YciI family protein [Candidatus Acidoferrales bacterium]|nr:YciI family protein [Candidatus Acidoferrales bacterium]
MKYICLVYGEEAKIAAMNDDECMEYDAAIRRSGQCFSSEALQRISTAKTVRVRDGRVSIVDGPFAETKEALAGFYLIDASSMDEAIEVASKIPPAQVGCIEVRPVRELVNTRGERRQIEQPRDLFD